MLPVYWAMSSVVLLFSKQYVWYQSTYPVCSAAWCSSCLWSLFQCFSLTLWDYLMSHKNCASIVSYYSWPNKPLITWLVVLTPYICHAAWHPTTFKPIRHFVTEPLQQLGDLYMNWYIVSMWTWWLHGLLVIVWMNLLLATLCGYQTAYLYCVTQPSVLLGAKNRKWKKRQITPLGVITGAFRPTGSPSG